MKVLFIIFFFYFYLSTQSFTDELSCSKTSLLFGNYKDNLIVKISDDKKKVEVDGESFMAEEVSLYDELNQENLTLLQGDKTDNSKIYTFTYDESRNLFGYSFFDIKNTKNNFSLFYNC
ncbi:hypothetical protein N9Y52_00020 [Candidatus Pelagibacter bacterium]|jgi:hypothetical protein|nr:hypothetical protein [Candidatus Pelagibacter bacterium]